jgi:hypothetical protein
MKIEQCVVVAGGDHGSLLFCWSSCGLLIPCILLLNVFSFTSFDHLGVLNLKVSMGLKAFVDYLPVFVLVFYIVVPRSATFPFSMDRSPSVTTWNVLC